MTEEQFEAHWLMAGPWMERALHYGGDMYALEDVKKRILDGSAHYHPGPTAVAVTEFVYTPKVKALNYWLLGGDTAGLRALLPHIEFWGITHDCTRFMGEGRRGFERRFGRDGYRAVATLYVKDVLIGAMQ